MEKAALQQKLNRLWGAIIVSQHVDLLNKSISLSLKVIEFGKETNYIIMFKNVSAFYYINDIGNRRFDIGPVDPQYYIELTSIDYYENCIGKISISSNDHWASRWYSSANFAMELWEAALFIEAKTIIIDGEVFDVGYPQVDEK